MQLRTGLIISSPSIHKYCSASSNSEPITVALQSSRVSMILNRSTEPCVDILLGSSGNLLGRYRKMKATSNEMIVRATGTFTLCASQIWTPEMEEKLCRSDAQRQAMAYGHGFTRIISPTGQVIAKMEHAAEGVLAADIDLGLIPVAKYFMDPAGHYSTPGNMQLFVDASRQKPVFILGEEECPRASPTRTSSSKFSRISPPGGCGPGRLRAASGRTLRNSNFPGR